MSSDFPTIFATSFCFKWLSFRKNLKLLAKLLFIIPTPFCINILTRKAKKSTISRKMLTPQPTKSRIRDRKELRK